MEKRKQNRLPALAADLVGRKVDLIVGVGDGSARAAKNATSTIPTVVLTDADPVAEGLVVRAGGQMSLVSTVTVMLNGADAVAAEPPT